MDKFLVTENKIIISNPDTIEVIKENQFKNKSWSEKFSIVTFKQNHRFHICDYSEDNYNKIINFLNSPDQRILKFSK